MLHESCYVFLSDVRGLEVKPKVCDSVEVFCRRHITNTLGGYDVLFHLQVSLT